MTALCEYCEVLHSTVIESGGGSRQDINGFLFECFRAMESQSEDLFSDELQSLRLSASEYVDYELTDNDKELTRAFAMGAIKAATRLCELFAISIGSQERAILQMRSLSAREQELLSKAVGILKKQTVLTHNALSTELGVDKSRLSQIFSTGRINPYFTVTQIGREKHYSLSSLGRDLYDGLQVEKDRQLAIKPIKSKNSRYAQNGYTSFSEMLLEIKGAQLREALIDRLEHSSIEPDEFIFQFTHSPERYNWEKFSDGSSKSNRSFNYLSR